jgi:para-nitrobenzyl esterase
MRSYWAEFAYSGTPGNGQSSTFTTWLPWDNSPDPVPRLMVFDTLSDNGIRMTNDRLSMENLRVRLLADKSYTSQDEHCSIYKRMFRGDAFNANEYANLGKSGCSQ